MVIISSEAVKCPLCAKNIPQPKNLASHLAQMHADCLCDKCDFKTNDKVTLRGHKSKPHNIKCGLCEYVTTSKGMLDQHATSTHVVRGHQARDEAKPEVLQCPDCGSKAKDLKEFQGHLRKKHKFDCSDCDFKYVTEMELFKHVNKTHGDGVKVKVNDEPAFNCRICDLRFTSADLLEGHLKIRHKLPPQSAKRLSLSSQIGPEGGQNSAKRRSLPTPNKGQISAENGRKCAKCPFTAADESDLRVHMAKEHHSLKQSKANNKAQKRLFKCEECDFESKAKLGLTQHLRNDPHRFKCPRCEFESKTKTALNEHLSNNPHNKEHVAAAGHQEMNNEAKAKLNLVSKTVDEGKFKCPDCGYESKSKQSLNQHVKKYPHKFHCSQCQHKTINRIRLEKHVLTAHKKIKGFQPDVNQPDPTKVQQLRCDICPFIGLNQRGMLMHKAKVHSGVDTFKVKHAKNPGTVDQNRLEKNVSASNKKINTVKNAKSPDPTKVQKFRCDTCPFIGSTQRGMMMHKTQVHSGNDTLKAKHAKNPGTIDQNRLEKNVLASNKKINAVKNAKSPDPTKGHKFQCDICSFIGSTQRGITVHKTRVHRGVVDPIRAKHPKEPVFKCKFCPFSGQEENSLKDHLVNDHKVSREKVSKAVDEIVRGLPIIATKATTSSVKAKGPDPKCPLCGFSSLYPKSNVNHQKTKHQHSCRQCPMAFVAKQKLKVHMKEVHTIGQQNKNIFSCEDCGQKFTHPGNLKSHLKLKHKFACDKCPRKFLIKSKLALHQREAHTKGEDEGNNNQDALVEAELAKDEEARKLKCQDCGHKFTQLGNLKSHSKLIHKFACDKCPRKFLIKSKLALHQREGHVEGEDEGNNNQEALVEAELAKDEEARKLKCQDCQKMCSSSGELEKHASKKHAHQCISCDLRFIQAIALLRHKKERHEDVQIVSTKGNIFTHFCGQCSFKTVSKFIMERHERMMHKISRPYNCGECSFTADKERKLIAHMLIRHPKVIKSEPVLRNNKIVEDRNLDSLIARS